MTTRNDLPFFKFSPGDWFKGDIRHCSPETKGVFVQLCAQMWIDGGKLSDDERLPAICGCDKQSFSNARAELDLWQILRYDDEGNIYISFISQQLHELSALREARAEAGRKGGNTKQLNRRSKAKAKSKQSSSIKNKEEEQEEDKENTPIVPKGTTIDDEFEEVWKLYPVKEDKPKARKAYTKARKKGDVSKDVICDGIERYKKYIESIRKNGFPDRRFMGGGRWFYNSGWVNEYTVEDGSKKSTKEEYAGLMV